MSTSMDFAKARYNMIEQQIRPNGVENPALLNAFQTLQRQSFFSPVYANIAYGDVALPIGKGRSCLRPETIGRFFQITHLSSKDKVLFIGEQSGYPAALASQLANHVTCLCQNDVELKENLKKNNIIGVDLVHGRFEDHADTIGTFDVVMFTGSLATLPSQAIALLNPLGRLVAVVGEPPIMTVNLITMDAQRQVTTKRAYEMILERY